jgi:hypothetical protein
LKASLNLLTLILVFRPTGTSNGSFGVWIASQWAFKELKSYLSSSMILSQPREDGELFIYLEVANFAVNVVLMWEEKGSRN